MPQRPGLLTLAELAERLACREAVALEWALSAGLEPDAEGWVAAEVEALLLMEADRFEAPRG